MTQEEHTGPGTLFTAATVAARDIDLNPPANLGPTARQDSYNTL